VGGVAVLLSLSACGSAAESSSETAKKAAAATETYREYLLENASTLVTWSDQLRHKLMLGISGAQSRYASARVPFGHLKAVLNSFPALDAHLDAPQRKRSGDRPGAFHRIERTLWKGNADRSAVKAAGEIIDSTLWLHEKLKTTNLSPTILVANAGRTLAEIAASGLRLEEEPYAEIDMLDASANLEGVEAALKAVRPLVVAQDSDLARQLAKEFTASFAAVEEFGVPARELNQPRPGSPGTSFIISYQITPEELRPLKDSIRRLSALFAQVPEAIADN
jgi:iron uptake system component EfeO